MNNDEQWAKLFRYLDEKFDKIDKSFDKIQQQQDEITKRLNAAVKS